jgi:DNA primase
MINVSVEQKTKELTNLVDICHSNLMKSSKMTHYLTNERKIGVSEIKKYNLGFFPQNIDVLAKYVNTDILKEERILDFFGESKFATTHKLIFPNSYISTTNTGQ